jgi:hypothetical protein
MIVSFLLALCAFAHTLGHGEEARQVFNFTGCGLRRRNRLLKLGWCSIRWPRWLVRSRSSARYLHLQRRLHGARRQPRASSRSVAVRRRDAGVVIANSLVLLFIVGNLVGLTSYLLIGSGITAERGGRSEEGVHHTRIGDVLFPLGMVWLYSQSGRCCSMTAGTAASNNSLANSSRKPPVPASAAPPPSAC